MRHGHQTRHALDELSNEIESEMKHGYSVPRSLGFAVSAEPWRQTPESFREALRNGCHLCHLIFHNASLKDLVSYNDRRPLIEENFDNVKYAFRPVSTVWAMTGRGHPLSGPSSGRTD